MQLPVHASHCGAWTERAACDMQVGGTLVYSTCTLSAEENEGVVAYALRGCDVRLALVPPHDERLRLGTPGWRGCGLSEEECSMVQRFDPSTDEASIGFFVAKFERL
jgi:16S rRNA C967 or C1407 C5-methylase (RsmB/RsmF family)